MQLMHFASLRAFDIHGTGKRVRSSVSGVGSTTRDMPNLPATTSLHGTYHRFENKCLAVDIVGIGISRYRDIVDIAGSFR